MQNDILKSLYENISQIVQDMTAFCTTANTLMSYGVHATPKNAMIVLLCALNIINCETDQSTNICWEIGFGIPILAFSLYHSLKKCSVVGVDLRK